MSSTALLYDDGAYVEVTGNPDGGSPVAPAGIVGRQVAGREFLEAYLRHGTWSDLVAVVENAPSRRSLLQLFASHPAAQASGRSLRIVPEQRFHACFFPTPPATLLHLPEPLHPRFAWARLQGGPGTFALTGVTHTLSSAWAMETLCSLVTAPFEPYDALICTSRAVVEVVRSVTDAYAEYLRERHGGAPKLRTRLALVPLGVDPERFRPPTPEERAARRRELDCADEEIVALFVGRLSFHAKAQPFPMYQGLARAAQATGRRVHLILAGWAAHEALLRAFLDGAGAFAPNVRLSVLDGRRPEIRSGAWQAADLFTSLADNVQETFGLSVVEAMACGLPVVASDWDGYRDLVADGETGLLVPTLMVRGATSSTTARLLLGDLNYDHYLAETSQAVIVDPDAAAEAYTRLIADADLRRRMGAAGRRRALERFDWRRVIGAYERLWRELEAERLDRAVAGPAAEGRPDGPPLCPAPERSFAGYPTAWLGERDRVRSVPGAEVDVERLLSLALTNVEPEARIVDPTILRGILTATRHPWTLDRLDDFVGGFGVSRSASRATVAWMLKYRLLHPVRA